MILNKEKLDRLYDVGIAKKEHDEIISQIDVRFGEIICLTIPKKDRDWFVYGNYSHLDENSGGFFDFSEYSETIAVGGEIVFPEPYCYADEGVGYIPTKWLWTEDAAILEEFNKEVAECKRLKEIAKKTAKQKRELVKLKKGQIKNIIISKLTKEELKYIKFK